jgi:two-component system OmpR family sensor kinase
MRKASILTLICIFFALTLVVINIAFVFEFKRQQSDLYYFTFQRFIMAIKAIRDHPDDSEELFKKLGVRRSGIDKMLLEKQGKKLLEDPFSHMVLFEKRLYFVPSTPPPPPPYDPTELFSPYQKPPFRHFEHPILENIEPYSLYRLWVLYGVIDSLLLLFFGMVFQKLLRLRHLKSDIRRAGEAKKFQPLLVNSEDELGEIATEFNQAMEKIHLLKEARTLFLRNVLHELKTPIMKGKILADTLEEEMKQEQLGRIFERLETLLGEMVKVEKLSSNEWHFEAKEYRLVDVLDHAMDLLMCDTSRIHIHGLMEAPLVVVDFELFATAIKNLLDNALKHSQGKIDVDVFKHSVAVTSFGEKLSTQRRDFSRPFNRSVEGSKSGLGLGLYIANSIIVKHGFFLDYVHVEEKNVFTIFFTTFKSTQRTD